LPDACPQRHPHNPSSQRIATISLIVYIVRHTALILLAIALAAASASVSGARTGPALKIRSAAPLVVVGSGFVARERVTITVRLAGKRVDARRLRAGAGGTFRLRFRTLLVTDTCSGSLLVLARGGAGSRASASRPCRPPDRQTPAVRWSEGSPRRG
jgi:hypothetical protein